MLCLEKEKKNAFSLCVGANMRGDNKIHRGYHETLYRVEFDDAFHIIRAYSKQRAILIAKDSCDLEVLSVEEIPLDDEKIIGVIKK